MLLLSEELYINKESLRWLPTHAQQDPLGSCAARFCVPARPPEVVNSDSGQAPQEILQNEVLAPSEPARKCQEHCPSTEQFWSGNIISFCTVTDLPVHVEPQDWLHSRHLISPGIFSSGLGCVPLFIHICVSSFSFKFLRKEALSLLCVCHMVLVPNKEH